MVPFKSEVNEFRNSLWGWLLGMMLILILLQAVVMNWGLSPLRQVANDLKSIEDGERETLDGDYPAEIEGVLATHSLVQDVAVFGIPNEEFGEEVKAAVELVPGVTVDPALAETLAAFCREHLAGYKTPKSFDFVEDMPRHETGKLYKRKLRDPYWEGTGRLI